MTSASPQLRELRADVGGTAVDVVVRAEVPREVGLSRSPGDGDDVRPHLPRVLQAEMTESADALNGDQVTGLQLCFEQCVVGREPGTEQRRRVDGRHLLGDRDQAGLACVEVFGVAAVDGAAGNGLIGAGGEAAATALRAHAAVSAEEANADPVTDRPTGHTIADGVDPAEGFVPGHHADLRRRMRVDGDRVAVADPAGLYLDADMSGDRPDELSPRRLQRPFGGDVDSAIGGHFFILFRGVGSGAVV
jgi:hypothetical protein